MDASTSGLLSRADMRERESRRLTLARAEIENSLAEKEIQQWHRSRSGSRGPSETSLQKTVHSRGGSSAVKKQEVGLAASMSAAHLLDVRSLPVSFTPKSDTFRPVMQHVPKRDFDRAMLEKDREAEQRLSDLRSSLNREMREYEANLRSEYEEKLDYLERKVKTIEANGRRDLKGDFQASAANEELRREYGEQLAEEAEKGRRAQEEILRLEHLLSVKTEEAATLQQTIDSLQQKSGQDDAQIHSLSESLYKLSQELSATKLQVKDGRRVKELEQENAQLRKDYGALTSAYKRTSNERKTLTSTEESPAKTSFSPSNPLRRRFDGTEGEGSETLRKYYEQKCLELSEEALQWREKARVLSSKHSQELQRLQRQCKQLRTEAESFQEETRAQMRDFAGKLQTKSESRLQRRQPQSVERPQRIGSSQKRAQSPDDNP